MIKGLLVPAATELFVTAVLGWIGLNIHRTSRDPKTPLADGVLLDLSLGLVMVKALGFLASASRKVFFYHHRN